MKYVVHTTITYMTEYDGKELKRAGVTSTKKLLQYANQNYDEDNVIDRKSEIFDKYNDTPKQPRFGIGSH